MYLAGTQACCRHHGLDHADIIAKSLLQASREKICCMLEAHKGLAIPCEETVSQALARGSYNSESLSEPSHSVQGMTRECYDQPRTRSAYSHQYDKHGIRVI